MSREDGITPGLTMTSTGNEITDTGVDKGIDFTIDGDRCSSIRQLASGLDCTTTEVVVSLVYAILIRYEGAEKSEYIDLGLSMLEDNQEDAMVFKEESWLPVSLPCEVDGRMSVLIRTLRERIDGTLKLEPKPLQANVSIAFNFPREFGHSAVPARYGVKLDACCTAEGAYRCVMRYACNSPLPEQLVNRFREHVQILVNHISTPQSTDPNLLNMPMQTQKEQVFLDKYNDTYKLYKRGDWLIHQLFEEKVKTCPNSIAVSCGTEMLTYRELDEMSSALAVEICSKMDDEKSSHLIGISVDPSIEMVIALFGIFKAGFAYVPLDPSYPEERLKYMVENSETSFILTKKSMLNVFTKFCSKVLCLKDLIGKREKDTLPIKTKIGRADDLAYVIYTSGSTGRPKGVKISHRNAVNTILDMNERYGIGQGDKLLLVASLSFDLSVYDIFGSLAAGATLVIPVPEVRGVPDPACWTATMKSHEVTIWDSAPAVMSLLVEYLQCEGDTLPDSLRLVVLSGDRIPLVLPTQLKSMIPNIQVVSQGGATEGSIWSIHYPIVNVNPEWKTIPYGMPLTNQKYYVLDEFLNPVPTRVVGELYIGGTGVAMGYMNNPEATSHRFIPSPFKDGGQIYKTGDLGRFNPDGYIEFCGRIDNQVKIRGFRVELSEIEAALISQEYVTDALVMKIQEKLVAYVVREKNKTLESSDLQRKISATLPPYMVPAFIYILDVFPVTANGKLDRRALPMQEIESPNQKLQPRKDADKKQKSLINAKFTEREAIIARVLAETFDINIELITPESSFYEIGGDSISAMTVVSALRSHGLSLTMQQILGQPTLGQLALIAKPIRSKTTMNHTRVDTSSSTIQLTPAQKWFFDQEFRNQNFWNQSFLLIPKKHIDQHLLEVAIKHLTSQHETLRCRFERGGDNKRVQTIMPSSVPNLVTKTLDSFNNLEAELDNIKHSLNISSGPLLGFGLFSVGEEQRLFITVHHLVVDLVSWRIIMDDLGRLYNGQKIGHTTMSFQDWSHCLKKHAESLPSNIWKQNKDVAPLCTDYSSNNTPTALSRKFTNSELDEETTKILTTSANEAFKTDIKDLLLTSLILAYRKSLGQCNLQIDLESHGREPWDESIDVSHTVGWFMTMFPIKMEILEGETDAETMENTLKLTKEKLRGVPQRGMPFWLLKYIKQADQCDLTASDVLFNYYGRFDQIQTKSNLWQTDDSYPCGEDEFDKDEKLTHKIVIESYIKSGRMNLKIFYCSDIHKDGTIASWMSEWKQNLTHLAFHCSQTGINGFTPSDFPLLKLSQSHLDDVLAVRLSQLNLNTREIEDMYPCTPMQEGFLFNLLRDHTSYLIQRTCTIKGVIDHGKLQECATKVVQRHDILRTRFIVDRLNGCMQVVGKTAKANWTFNDWSNLTDGESLNKEQQYLNNDRQRGFDFSEPMLRFSLFKYSPNSHRLIVTAHHSIVDGFSFSLIFQEILLAYNDSVLPEAPKYRRYVEEILDSKMNEYVYEGFWKEEMHNLPELGGLRFLPPVYPAKGHSVAHRTIMKGKFRELISYAEKNNISVAAILCASWAFVLNKYSCDPKDVLFGFVLSGRGSSIIENMNRLVGVTINTLPLRVKIHDHHVANWLKYIQGKVSTVMSKELTSMADIQKWCGLKPDEKLFDTVLSYQTLNQEFQNSLTSAEVSMDSIYDHEYTEYNLTLDVLNTGTNMEVKVIYNSSVIDESAVQHVVNHLETTMTWISNATEESTVDDIDLMTSDERTILNGFNPVDEYQQKLGHIKGIHQLFERMVDNLPEDHKALVKDGQFMTYSELNRAANNLATRLRHLGLKREEKVGLILDREMTMPIGMLGIWKAGGTFVSIDSLVPASRISYILEDCGCRFAVNASVINTTDLPHDVSYISLNNGDIKLSPNTGGQNPENINEASDTAYMVYTSGTTGHPKGALVKHQGLINVLMYKPGGILNIDPQSKVLQSFSVGFDGAIGDTFTTLCHGGCLYLPSQDFTETMKQVDAVGCTPSTLNVLNPNDYTNVKVMFVGGEPCSQSIAKRWSPGRTLINAYGPTECSIITHAGQVTHNKRLSVGKPLPNTKSYVLDSSLRQIPINVAGELYIGGVNVGKGYHRRPDLTEAAFIENPFDTGVTYKTGDLARWLSNGEIEIIGRKDHQVKIRGKRIELGEIKSVIETCPGVKHAHVTVQDGQYILAHIVTSANVDQTSIGARMKIQLPKFMMPTAMFFMDSFPLTVNKKIDNDALPKFVAKSTHGQGRTACDDLENAILSAYREVVDQHFNMEDDFFELGGHSLLAITLKTVLHENTGLEISMSDVMGFTTPAELADEVKGRASSKQSTHIGAAILHTSPTDENGFVISKTSTRQEQMCLLYELAPDSSVYNVPVILDLRGSLDIGALEASIEYLTHIHQAFRTYFRRDNDQSFSQAITPHTAFHLPFELHDYSNHADSISASRQFLYTQVAKAFNLYTSTLARFIAVKLNDNYHQLLILMHHSVTDGASIKIIINQLEEVYVSYLSNSQPDLQLPKLNYIDYSNWERQMLEGRTLERQLQFWKNHLEHATIILDLPVDRPRPAVPSYEGGTVFFQIPDEVVRKLNRVAFQSESTLFTSLVTVYASLLRLYCQADDIVVGAFFSGRHIPGTEGIVGYFVNTLPLRVKFETNSTFDTLLTQVKELMFEVLDNQDVPFQKIVESLHVSRDTSYNPIIQAAIVLQEGFTSRQISDDLTMGVQDFNQFTAKFDLNLEFVKVPDGKLGGQFVFNTDIFERSTIQRMSQHLQYLLEMLPTNSDTPLLELNMLPPAQVHLIDTFNTSGDRTSTLRIHQQFELQASKTPKRIAVEQGNRYITYMMLNAASNNLARRLRHLGVAPETVVGIVGERNLELIISKLGILKSSGAFLCIEGSLPADRVKFMLEETNCKFVVTTSKIKDTGVLKTFDGAVLVVNAEKYTSANTEKDIAKEDHVNLDSIVDSSNLAYVVYTSGSTGKPKGVMVTHGGLQCVVPRDCDVHGFEEGLRMTHFLNIMFDASILEIFVALTTGATLVQREKNYIETLKRVDVATMTPSVLASLDPRDFPNIKKITVGGEILPRTVLSKWENHVQLFNAYGPAETTIECAVGLINGQDRVTVGKPINGSNIFILGDDLKPVPIGVTGTIFIGGTGVARGYVNRPELTLERFIENPFGEGRLYNSGDVGMWTEDGQVIVVGRMDRQVKIRGFRIELEEVEHIMKMQKGITNAAVAVKRDMLVGYVTPDIQSSGVFELKQILDDQLPRYMVPSVIVPMNKFPMSAAEKVDYKRLPEPNFDQKEILTKKENLLVQIWSDVLQIDPSKIKSRDSFFNLGGDSISAMKVFSLGRKRNLRFTVQQIFQTRSLGQLARIAEFGKVENNTQNLPLFEATGSVPLTPIQEWFFSLNLQNKNQFNQSLLLRLQQPINQDKLRRAFEGIVAHHDILRTAFQLQGNGTYEQEVTATTEKPFRYIRKTLDEGLIKSEISILQRSLNLETGPIIAVGVFEVVDKYELLFITIHHLVVDLVSWQIILEDLETLYHGDALQQKTTSFRKWSRGLHDDYAPTLSANVWPDIEQCGSLKQDYPDQSRENATCSTRITERIKLDENTSRKLMKLQGTQGSEMTSVADVLLTGLMVAYNRCTGESSLNVEQEWHGRTPWNDKLDVSRTVGWFTVIYPVVLQAVKENADMTASLQETKRRLRNIPQNGMPYGTMKYLKKDQDPKYNQQCDVLFNYHGSATQYSRKSKLWEVCNMEEYMQGNVNSDERISHALVIECSIVDGCLQGEFIFSTELHHRESIQKLAQSWSTAVADITSTLNQDISQFKRKREPLQSDSRTDQIERVLKTRNIKFSDIEDMYECTPLQEGFIFSLLQDKSSYLVQYCLDLTGGLDVDRFKSAWNTVIAHHSILRTSFFIDPETHVLTQFVARHITPHWETGDWTDGDSNKQLTYVGTDRAKGFAMNDVLVRFALMKTGNEKHRFIWTFHHALIDGWSAPIVLKDVMNAYHARDLAPAAPFKDFVKYTKRQDTNAAKDFWVDYLNNLQPIRTWSVQERSKSGRLASQEITRKLSVCFEDLRQFARSNSLTLSSVLFGALALVLDRYSSCGGNDVVVGIVMASRSAAIEGVENMVGLLLNTLPLRISVPRGNSLTLAEWLLSIQKHQAAIMSYDYSNLADIKQWSGLTREHNLFDVIVGYENYPAFDNTQNGDIGMHNIHGYEKNQSGLGVQFFDNSEDIKVKVMSGDSIYNHDLVLQILLHVDNVLVNIVKSDASEIVASLDILHVKPEDIEMTKSTNSFYDGVGYSCSVKDKYGRPCPLGVPGKLVIEQQNIDGECVFFSGVAAANHQSFRKVYVPREKNSTVKLKFPNDLNGFKDYDVTENEHGIFVFVAPNHKVDPAIVNKIKSIMSVKARLYVIPVDEIVQLDVTQIDEITCNVPHAVEACATLRSKHYEVTDDDPTEAEAVLRDTWSHLLRIEADDIKLDHSFFDLGGNSIMAISMVSLAAKRGLIFNLTDVLELETLKELAAAATVESDDGDVLVRLNKGKDGRTPIVCVHASDGGTSSYSYVAGHLKENPIYAFRFVEGITSLDSVVDLASEYVNRMEKLSFVTNNSSYVLIGYSSGAAVAFEMAVKLEKMQRSPEKLVLIDGTPDLISQSYANILNCTEEELEQFEEWFKSTWKSKRLDEDDLTLGLSIFRESVKVFASYEPLSDYNGSVTLIRARDQLPDGPLAKSLAEMPTYGPDGGIQRHCSNPVIIMDVEGDHYTMMRDETRLISDTIVR